MKELKVLALKVIVGIVLGYCLGLALSQYFGVFI